MHPDQYTDDAICRSMGIGAFVDPAWSHAAAVIRILLKPSFSPEVCLTLREDLTHSSLSIVALSESFWQQACPCRLLEYREDVAVGRGVFDRIKRVVEDAYVRQEHRPRVIWIDGMRIACCFSLSGKIIRFDEYTLGGRESFLSLSLEHAWNACSVPEIKNILSECGRYINLKFPELPVPSRPQKMGIMVLGVPEEKAELFRELSRAASRPARGSSSPQSPISSK